MGLDQAIKAREGDFIETFEGLIFDVKGLVHPPDRVIAYLRYFERPLGERRRGGKRYSKVYSLSDREAFLRKTYPCYIYYDSVFGEWLEGVPHKYIRKHYQPIQKTLELLKASHLDDLEICTIKFIEEIHDFSGTPLKSLGVSGSVLVGLHTSSSDIDVIVYGRANCLSVYRGLEILLKERRGGFLPYGQSDLKRLYSFRSRDTWMPFDKFCEVERRKVSQGRFLGRDFFVRFVLDWDEVGENYGDRVYRGVGYAKISAHIEDDSDSIFTPCTYRISEVRVLEGACNTPLPREIVSFRGRFSGQARRGEWVVAQGKIERVIDRDGSEYYRMILGAKPSDFMFIERT